MCERYPMSDCIPYLACTPARHAVDWYCNVFGATCSELVADGAERIAHAELTTANGRFFVSSVYPEQHLHDGRTQMSTSTAVVFLCPQLDVLVERAVSNGATLLRAVVAHQNAKFRDPFGHTWIIVQQHTT